MFVGGGGVWGGGDGSCTGRLGTRWRGKISSREAVAGSNRVEVGRPGRDEDALAGDLSVWCMALLRIPLNAAWTGVTRVPPILLASMDPSPPAGSYSSSLISPSSLSSGATGDKFGLPILSANEGFGLEIRSRRAGACCEDTPAADAGGAAPKMPAGAGGRGSCERAVELLRAAALSWRISDEPSPGFGGRAGGGCCGEAGSLLLMVSWGALAGREEAEPI